MPTVKVIWEARLPDDAMPPDTVHVPDEVYYREVTHYYDKPDAIAKWLTNEYGYLVKEWFELDIN